MTKKKEVTIRNRTRTKEQLIAAVGEILRKEGFTELKVSRIAQVIDKDRKLIHNYFHGIQGLLTAYIHSKDHWLPFFERFNLSGEPGVMEIQALFTDLMQENLRSFYEDVEMQHIIRWQIGQQSDLLNDISETREEEGEKLFAPTDATFADSGVDFRAVIGLLLGGSYYMGLHSRTNRSKVCGMDINRQKDMAVVLDTIAQIISWACEAARESQLNAKPPKAPSKIEFESLEALAERLSKKDKGRATANEALVKETQRLKAVMPEQLRVLANAVQIGTYLKIWLTRLSRICNLLHDAGREHNADAAEVLKLMNDVRGFTDVAPPDSTVMPRLFCQVESEQLELQFRGIRTRLEVLETDPLLIEIIGAAFSRFGEHCPILQWSDYRYLRGYADTLEKQLARPADVQQPVHQLLIGLQYNHTRFSAYYTRMLAEQYTGKDAVCRNEVLRQARHELRKLPVYTSLRYDLGKEGISEELSRWMDAELAFPWPRTGAAVKAGRS